MLALRYDEAVRLVAPRRVWRAGWVGEVGGGLAAAAALIVAAACLAG